MKISVVIAAKNEEDVLQRCLDSVKFADEIVLVDDESTDRTVEIAKMNNVKIFHRKLDGFASQKNYGISKCANKWVLVIDADEVVSDQLRNNIGGLDIKTELVAFDIPRRNHLGKKWLRHGGLYPDYQRRLFDRSKCKYGKREVHEILVVDGSCGTLQGDILHATYKDYGEYLAKVNKYAVLEAQWTERRPSVLRPVRVFAEKYFAEKGILDGLAGLISALLLAYYQVIIRREMSKK